MENIYLDKNIAVAQIKNQLALLFPDLKVFYYDFTDEPPMGMDFQDTGHIFFHTLYSEDKLEFGLAISIYGMPNEDEQERALFIATSFSAFFKLRVLVPYTLASQPHHPYYDIIIDRDRSFLADDCDTSFADDSDGLVKIIEAYPLQIIGFDGAGKCLRR